MYAHKLMEANVPVSAVRIIGTIHGFVSIDQLRNSPPSITAMQLTQHALQEVLH
jgi:acetyl esterase/lipase